jgi:hypothetical protein
MLRASNTDSHVSVACTLPLEPPLHSNILNILKRSGLAFTYLSISYILGIGFFISPHSSWELKEYIFIDYAYLLGLCVETFLLELAKGFYLALHCSQEYICYIPRVWILWFLHEKNCHLLEVSPSKIFFMWHIEACLLKYYSSHFGKSIINYFSPVHKGEWIQEKI